MSFKKIQAFLFIVVLILLDQWTKFWARSFLAVEGPSTVINQVLEFRYAENTGVAFSMFDKYPFLLTVLITLINLVILVILLRKQKIELFWIFIFAGAVSNLLDRYIFGFVTDFINPLFVNFAVFNVADVFLNIGLYIYLYFCFFVNSNKS